jgi:hypothetical protein
MGKLTISMAIFNSFLYVYQRVSPPVTISSAPPGSEEPPKLGGVRSSAVELWTFTAVDGWIHGFQEYST